ncbi:MAG: DNA-directed RNA polymerase subunit beta' [Planctomycetota bacterium]
MVETIYEKINDYAAVSIKLASPEDIRSKWSYGEVKKPETINYRTYRSEKDGLFCERIFGPEKDWECACGKYKGIKHKGIICDKCGVMITHSRVRRERMGHINLAAAVAHIWFFKAMPSRIGNLLAMKTASLEKVVYFQDYVVVDAGDTPLKACQLLTEEEFRESREKYGNTFKAAMGAEAIREILSNLDLGDLSQELREELKLTRSVQKIKDIIKRLKTVEMLRDSPNRPEWMIMDVIPVIPPDLRPLVLLDSGNFATSDLNDLYRRLINRNNRLKKLLDLNAPDVIIRNEKRMLQQSVDALFDNGRCRRPVLGSSNRPLKSLTDMIKGKQGRFRENLLGKRVDYSARSVIVVGPDLKLHQCGLPKIIALELFQPFIIRRLKELGLADTIKSAKKMLERRDEHVWDILEEVIQGHPVLLNRAPTLHRMGIQAFEPVLIEGNAIRIHPLVCGGYNADFDGDQMAVHLPLSFEAQIEASTLMLSSNNIFTPAHGGPIIAPSQDIVLGCFYLTFRFPDEKLEGKPFRATPQEAWMAHAIGKLRTHQVILVQFEEGQEVHESKDGTFRICDGVEFVETTPGRLIFNDILPEGMPFYNITLDKGALSKIIADCHERLGRPATLRLLDSMKSLGFKASTLAGLSFGKDDLAVPDARNKIVEKTQKEVDAIQLAYEHGQITDGERYSKIIDCWTRARDLVGAELLETLRNDCGARESGKTGALGGREPLYINPIFCMVSSKARGSVEQIRQLAGMRGLMARPSGKIIETPIRANFREGLKVLEYFSSTHGARKGLADTALKTADSGYLTRKLADVAQNVVVTIDDCATPQGVKRGVVYQGDKIAVSLSDAIRGRVSMTTIEDPVTGEIVVSKDELLTVDIAKRLQDLGYDSIQVRSPLTCEADQGVCARCYGMDLSRGDLVELGQAVGIIAAQSIGEPGTQLTMRTFHIGGTASKTLEESEIKAKRGGKVGFQNLQVVANEDGDLVALNRKGELIVFDPKGRESIATSSRSAPRDRGRRRDGQGRPQALRLGPAPRADPGRGVGQVRMRTSSRGARCAASKHRGSRRERKMIMEHKGEMHPQILIVDEKDHVLSIHPLPERAYIEAEDGVKVKAGALLAKTSREITGTQDITGGLPRVTELFEARKPKEPAVLAEIDGKIELGEKKRSKRTIIIRGDGGIEIEHLVPHGSHLRVHRGDNVVAGEPLTEGALVPHDTLRIQGEQAVLDYLLREIQAVYRAQGVTVDDKHIEIILGQMMRKVQVDDPGDSDFLPGAVVDKFKFRRENDRLKREKKKPATVTPLLLGVTKASLQSESFISAASFQETTKVLTEAARAGRRDALMGLKENVILGHLVPTGTGFPRYQATQVRKNIDLQAAAAELLSHAQPTGTEGAVPAFSVEIEEGAEGGTP